MKLVKTLPQISIVYSHQTDGDFRGTLSVAPWLAQVGLGQHSLTHLKLSHGDQVEVLDDPFVSLVPADSAVLLGGQGGLSLVVGDCFPIVLVDPVAKIMALVHGGWRSLAAGILPKTISEMTANGASAARLRVWLGPGIRPCCYQSVELPQQANEQKWCSFVTKISSIEQQKSSSKSAWRIDLPGYILAICQSYGIYQTQMVDEQLCTCCQSEQFFSHTRSKKTGAEDGRFLVATFWP